MNGHAGFLLPLLLLLLPTAVQAATINAYFLGNSLTVDGGISTVESELRSAGYESNIGWQIGNSGRLSWFAFNNPEYSTAPLPPAPFGTWENALTNYQWDVVALQPYRGTNGEAEVLGFNQIVSTATPNVGRFLVYGGWPSGPEGDAFSDGWALPYDSQLSPIVLSEDFFSWFYQTVRLSNPTLTIDYVPLGEVLAVLDQRLRETSVAGFASVDQLYRDDYHLNIPSGRFVAHSTLMSVLLRQDPQRIQFENYWLDNVDADLIDLVNEVVWDVVSNDTRTGVGVSVPEASNVFFMPFVLLLLARRVR